MDKYYALRRAIDFALLRGGRSSRRRHRGKTRRRGSTQLVDSPSDLSTAGAIKLVVAIRDRAHAGYAVDRTTHLYTIAKTVFGTHFQLYLDRAYYTEALFPSIAHASDSIHMAMLTLDGGELGKYLVDLLLSKKRQHPAMAIRVLVDDFSSDALWPWSKGRRNLTRLRRAGIHVQLNHFFREGLEHRKLLVVDGTTAFIGGASFEDAYFGNKAYWAAYKAYKKARRNTAAGFDRSHVFNPYATPEGASALLAFEVTARMELPTYHDFGIKCVGPAVLHLQASFLQSWMAHGQRDLDRGTSSDEFVRRYFPKPKDVSGALLTAPVKLIHGIPKGESEFRHPALDIIDTAQRTLDINFPYILIPEFIDSVRRAAERGVKVRLLVPGKEGIDKEATWSIFRSYYMALLSTGNVEIHEFRTYTHCKFIVADRRFVFTSTGNPEYNSWEGGWDETALIDSPTFAEEIELRVFDKDLPLSKPITFAALKDRSIWDEVKLQAYKKVFSLFQMPRELKRPRRIMIARR